LLTFMYLNKTPKSRSCDIAQQGHRTSDVRRPTFDVSGCPSLEIDVPKPEFRSLNLAG
jgi:hypothetical protein